MKAQYRVATAAAGVAVMVGGLLTPAHAANQAFKTCAGSTVASWRSATSAGTQADGSCRKVTVRLKLTSTNKWSKITVGYRGLAERTGNNRRSAHTWSNPNNDNQAGSVGLPT